MATTTFADRLVLSLDRAVRTLSPGSARARRPNPAQGCKDANRDPQLQEHIAGLMRVNHTGEVCAQALYQGQALAARRSGVKEAMARAADEEIDHLAWCEERLSELQSQPSALNPAFYALSFSLGALTGLVGDRISLGFVAATEQQVCEHLREHLAQLPEGDERSRRILETMLADEAEHADNALAGGGVQFSGPLRQAMTLMSRVMTRTTYHV